MTTEAEIDDLLAALATGSPDGTHADAALKAKAYDAIVEIRTRLAKYRSISEAARRLVFCCSNDKDRQREWAALKAKLQKVY